MNLKEVHHLVGSLPRQPRRTGETRDRRSSTTDLLRLYLQDIGRVDLLTNEEEVTLARLVQRREALPVGGQFVDIVTMIMNATRCHPLTLVGGEILKAHIRTDVLEIGIHRLSELTLIERRAALLTQ